MVSLVKCLWGFRLFIYSAFFKNIDFPGYMGSPLIITGLKKIKIGKKFRLYPNSRIEVLSGGSIVIGNNVSIGQNLHMISGGELVIENDCLISANVFITNVDHSYQDIEKPVSEQDLVTKNTRIGCNCFIGYGVVLQAGTLLGNHCIVGANSVVKGVFPDYSVVVGAPAKIIKKYDKKEGKWAKVT